MNGFKMPYNRTNSDLRFIFVMVCLWVCFHVFAIVVLLSKVGVGYASPILAAVFIDIGGLLFLLFRWISKILFKDEE